jgi:hypothetical protein
LGEDLPARTVLSGTGSEGTAECAGAFRHAHDAEPFAAPEDVGPWVAAVISDLDLDRVGLSADCDLHPGDIDGVAANVGE